MSRTVQAFINGVAILALFAGGLQSNQLNAQDIFSGAGIRGLETRGAGSETPKESAWPSFFQKDRAIEGERKPLSWPKLGLFKNNSRNFEMGYENDERPGFLEGLPRIFPERDPAKPPFFQNLNERTKAFFARSGEDFSGWASRTNQNARERTSETWDTITRGFKRPFENSAKKVPMTQPPVRSAQTLGETPGVKF